MLQKRKVKKKHAVRVRREKSWQLVFVLLVVLLIPLFVFVVLQSSRSQRVLGTSTERSVSSDVASTSSK